jgi:hypothetical protein
VTATLLPMSNDPAPTRVDTVAHGLLSFQSWLVQHRAPEVRSVVLPEGARVLPRVLDAIHGCDVVIIGPSNPYVSVLPIVGLAGFLRHVVVGQGSNLFGVWVLMGGMGAALVFAATVISVPLLLDRRVDLHAAVLTSLRAVGANPGAMAIWATIIMVLTALSMATAMVGFAFSIPVLGHASWHAYRATVDASSAPRRE